MTEKIPTVSYTLLQNFTSTEVEKPPCNSPLYFCNAFNSVNYSNAS